MSSEELPYFTRGTVVKGFGRGSKQLGIPTANYPEDIVAGLPPGLESGVYYGWACVENGEVYKMVMSVGWNPHFNNTERSMETHILHKFNDDFYGSELAVCMTGYLRPEKSFNSLEELIQAIHGDIAAAEQALDNPSAAHWATKLKEFIASPKET